MRSTINNRLRRLETAARLDQAPPRLLLLMIDGVDNEREVTGIALSQERQVLRRPGESLDALQQRATRELLEMGQSLLVAWCTYADGRHTAAIQAAA